MYDQSTIDALGVLFSPPVLTLAALAAGFTTYRVVRLEWELGWMFAALPLVLIVAFFAAPGTAIAASIVGCLLAVAHDLAMPRLAEARWQRGREQRAHRLLRSDRTCGEAQRVLCQTFERRGETAKALRQARLWWHYGGHDREASDAIERLQTGHRAPQR